MIPKKQLLLVISCLLLLNAAEGVSQTAASLKGAFGRETQLLDEALDDYGRSRAYEQDAIENLRQLSAQVSGPYRLSNGRQGSLQGTLYGDRLRLQAIDAASGQIEGRWTAMDLSSGLPSTGDWLADKDSSQEEIDLEQ